MPEKFEGELSSRVDPEKQKGLDEFRQIEEKIFITPKDQRTAKKVYEDMKNKYYFLRSMMKQADFRPSEEMKFRLKSGTIVYRGGTFQEIGQSFEIGIQNIDYDAITSNQLPDGSVLYLTDISALESAEKSGEWI